MGYWLNMLTHFQDSFLTLPNLDFITAHSSLITAQMCSVFPPILGPGTNCTYQHNSVLHQLLVGTSKEYVSSKNVSLAPLYSAL